MHNQPTTGAGEKNAAGKGRSWYLPDNEHFSLRRNIDKSGTPLGVLYMGFRNEIKVQLFRQYLSVTFREGDFAFRVYKNCTVEFVE